MRRAGGVALLLMAAGVTAASAARERPFDLAAAPDASAREYVRTNNLSALKGVRKVVIPSFQMEFVVETQTHQLAPARTNDMARLTGVDREAFTRIADGFHAALVAGLKGLGVEVLPAETVRGAAAWDEYKPAPRGSPTTVSAPDHTSLLLSVADMPLYFNIGDRRVPDRFTRVPPAFEVALAKEVAVPLLRVRMVIDITRHTGEVKGKAAVTLKESATGLTVITPSGRTAVISLGENVNAAAATFEVKGVDPSFWDDAPAPFYSATKSPSHAIQGTSPTYEKAVNDHLGAVLAMFLAEIKTAL
ncbi:MAG: hypothetical protein ACREAA_19440 [Candidatus Polarisedimenticolia bacterium]